MRPVQSALPSGSQTSHLISESLDGRATPCTRQNATGAVAPLTTVPAATTAAELTVESAVATAARPLQSVAACAPLQTPARASIREPAFSRRDGTCFIGSPCLVASNDARRRPSLAVHAGREQDDPTARADKGCLARDDRKSR